MADTLHPELSPVSVGTWSSLSDREPAYALVANVDLVVVRYEDNVSVLYGRCLHRGALMADGRIKGDCIAFDDQLSVAGWRYTPGTPGWKHK